MFRGLKICLLLFRNFIFWLINHYTFRTVSSILWTVLVMQTRHFRSLVDLHRNALCLAMIDGAIQNRVGRLRCVANRLLTKTRAGKSILALSHDTYNDDTYHKIARQYRKPISGIPPWNNDNCNMMIGLQKYLMEIQCQTSKQSRS